MAEMIPVLMAPGVYRVFAKHLFPAGHPALLQLGINATMANWWADRRASKVEIE